MIEQLSLKARKNEAFMFVRACLSAASAFLWYHPPFRSGNRRSACPLAVENE